MGKCNKFIQVISLRKNLRKHCHNFRQVWWFFFSLSLNSTTFLWLAFSTGKSLSEDLIFAWTIWRQIVHWITSSMHENYKLKPRENMFLTFRTIFVHNMFSPCSAKRRASDKDLPVMAKENYSDFQYKNIHFEKNLMIPIFIWKRTKIGNVKSIIFGGG